MKKKPEFHLDVATEKDVDDIQGLLYPGYFKESIYSGLEYDADNTRDMIKNWLNDICIIAKSDGKTVGVVSMYFMKSFYKQTEADVEMFYVLPEFRGTGVSRALVDALVQNAERNKAAVIYTCCASGINEKNNKMYTNLFKKFGFNVLGTELMRLRDV